ncbi:hypothetical protein JCM10449v2_006363 [Rhodotorula kratochvilovae]
MPVATLPDELVLLVIESCDHLEKDREKTLAALCRLAKRYREAAERVLYSRVELEADFPAAQPVTPGTPLYTLTYVPRLRPYVKSVTLEIFDEHARLLPVVDLLSDLKNVEELSRHWAAFSSVTRLVLGTILINAATAPPLCAGVTSFSLEDLYDLRTFVTFTSAFASHLTCLRLPMTSQLQGHSLAIFPNLKHLSLVTHLAAQGLVVAIPHAASVLDTAGSLTSFGVLIVRENTPHGPQYAEQAVCDFGDETLAEIPPLSTHLLQAIPPQVQRLSFVTFLFRADDVATFLLGPSRPPALRTLRLGGGVGQGFKESARSRSAWYSNFERTMEEAGVEVTTVE